MLSLTGIVLASLFLGCAQTKTPVQAPHPSSQTAKEWAAEEHQEAVELLHEEAVRLEDQVAHLEQRVERFNKKPHLDPKGFKRQSWKRRIGAYQAEISELYERIAWHHGETDRVNGVLPSEEKVLPPHLSSQTAKEWSAEEHREAADLLDEDAIRLKAKVAHLEQRVERFNKKPYLDPKEIKRQEWRALIRANREEISELREQIIWHHGEAERLTMMPPS
jgi:predicted  nucleic acid-binding Zn-ribbon protein